MKPIKPRQSDRRDVARQASRAVLRGNHEAAAALYATIGVPYSYVPSWQIEGN